MIKYGSYPTTIEIPFEKFSNEFNLELHFGIKGIKKRFFNTAIIEIHNAKKIRLYERKDIYCNYYSDNKGNTIVEYTAEMSIFSIIVWIISLFLIVGFFIVPITIFGRKWGCSLARNKINKYWHSYISTNNPELLYTTTASRETDNTINKASIPNMKNALTPSKHPPPINITNLKKPPPLPKMIDPNVYYIVINEKQIGPINIEKIALLIDVDQLAPSTLVWKEGMPDWVNASTIETINHLFKK
jgi:hypothetical protein